MQGCDKEIVSPEAMINQPIQLYCAGCKQEFSDTSSGQPNSIFINLKDKTTCICTKCLFRPQTGEGLPYLCTSLETMRKHIQTNEVLNVRGIVIECKENPRIVSFCKSLCAKCQRTTQTSFKFHVQVRCLECQDAKGIWCEDCFNDRRECTQDGHKMIVELYPFTFWSEEMSNREILHFIHLTTAFSQINRFHQAEAFRLAEKYEKAEKYYELRYPKVKKYSSKMIILYSLGSIYIQLLKYNKAEPLFLELQSLNKEHNDITNLITPYCGLASVYEGLGRYREALKTYNKALEIAEQLPKKGDMVKAIIYRALGSVKITVGKYQEACELISKSRRIYARFIDINISELMEMYNKAMEVAKRLSKEKDTIKALMYGGLGSVNTTLEKYQEVYKLLSKSGKIYARFGIDISVLMSFYKEYGNLLQEVGNYGEAMEYYTKTLEINKIIHGEMHSATAASYSKLGEIYHRRANYKEAIEFYSKSLEINRVIYGEQHSTIANLYESIGCVHDELGEYIKAQEMYDKSLEIRKLFYG